MVRRDVKVGMAVGGVLLAVLIVYVLVVPAGDGDGAEQLVTVEGGDTPAQVADAQSDARPGNTGDAPAIDVAPVVRTPDALANDDSASNEPTPTPGDAS